MERNFPTGLAALVGAVLALTFGLHRTGDFAGLVVDWSNPMAWVETSSPDLVVGALLRQVGLIVGYWVLVSTFLYAIARGLNAPTPWARFVMLPVARRLVDRALAASLAVSLLGSPLVPALAAEPPVVLEASDDGIPVPHVRVIEPPPAGPPGSPPSVGAVVAPASPPLPATAESITPQEPAGSAAATHVVMEGDNLWTIAAAHLSSLAESPVGNDRIGNYWRTVIEENRATLRSGDPNLIYPGEMITLPPIGEVS